MIGETAGRSQDIAAGNSINIAIDVAAVVTSERQRLQECLDSGDLTSVISHYPVRETPALSKIAQELGFQERDQYESAVRKLLMACAGF